MIAKCNCTTDSRKNETGAKYMDKKYGKNMRVHTVSGKVNKIRCCVCGSEKSFTK